MGNKIDIGSDFAAVYVCPIGETVENKKPLNCEMRNLEIENAKNAIVKTEKYFAWLLLEYAMKDVFGEDASSAVFEKKKSGKWVSNLSELSISHCDGLVAVALSDKAIGVDIEPLHNPRILRLKEKILSADELETLKEIEGQREQTEHIIRLWTAKEAIYKRLFSDMAFVPNSIPVSNYSIKTEKISLAEREYIISVATDSPVVINVLTAEAL